MVSQIKLSVRPAAPDDALAIGQVQSLAMAEALSAGLERPISDSARAMLDVGQLASTWMMTIGNLPSPDCHVLVADANGEVEGFAVMAPAHPHIGPDDDENGLDRVTSQQRVAFEIHNFDVPSRYSAQEHEPRLLAAITDIARESGATEVHIWVIAGHDKQTQFLHNSGFAPRPVRRVTEIDGGEIMEYLWWAVLEDPHGENEA